VDYTWRVWELGPGHCEGSRTNEEKRRKNGFVSSIRRSSFSILERSLWKDY
jgi:hypothetical protein